MAIIKRLDLESRTLQGLPVSPPISLDRRGHDYSANIGTINSDSTGI